MAEDHPPELLLGTPGRDLEMGPQVTYLLAALVSDFILMRLWGLGRSSQVAPADAHPSLPRYEAPRLSTYLSTYLGR